MKPHMKSVRMTDEVYGFIEKFTGNGFNDKLENLVLFAKKNEKNIADRIGQLEKTRDALVKEIAKLNSLKSELASINMYVKSVARMCEKSEVPGQIAM